MEEFIKIAGWATTVSLFALLLLAVAGVWVKKARERKKSCLVCDGRCGLQGERER